MGGLGIVKKKNIQTVNGYDFLWKKQFNELKITLC